MSQQRSSRVVIDPFFDGNGTLTQQSQDGIPAQYAGTGNIKGTTTADCYTPNPSGYSDISQLALVTGQNAASVMAPRHGMRGTVIPRATKAGVPAGVDPHKKVSEVVIDPHIPGQSARVKLADLNEAIITRAETMADQVAQNDGTMGGLRLHGAAVFHQLSAITGQSPVQADDDDAVDLRRTVAVMPDVATREVQASYQQPATISQTTLRRTSSPLAAFGVPVHPEPANTSRVVTPRVVTPTTVAVSEREASPPTEYVTFEIQHFGTQNARYHDVLIISGFLILVYNKAYVHGDPYWPPSREDSPPMALQVRGQNTIYLVRATGIQYAYGSNEFCILAIEQQAEQE